MSVIALSVAGMAIGLLYRTALERETQHLRGLVSSHVALIERMGTADAAFTAERVGGMLVQDRGEGTYGTQLLLRFTGDAVDILTVQEGEVHEAEAAAWRSWPPIQDMRAGHSGTFLGEIPGGVRVLAAYAGADGGRLGIVAYTGLRAFRAPYYRAAMQSLLFAVGVIILGVLLFFAISDPIIRRLREGEARFRALFDGVRDAAVVTSRDAGGGEFVVRDVNRSAEREKGEARAAIIDQPVGAVFPQWAGTGLLDLLHRIEQSGAPEFQPAVRFGGVGDAIWKDLSVYPLPNGEMVAMYEDVTERRTAERRLRESEQRWRSIISLQADATLIIDSGHRIVFANEAAGRLFGKAVDTLIGETFGFPVAEGDVAEIEIVRPEGSVAYAEMQVIPLQSYNDAQYLLFIRDVSAHRRTEGDLRKLFQAIEQSPASVVITDIGGRIEYVNPKFTQATGFTYAEVVGKNPRVLKSGNTSGDEYRKLWETISEGGVWRGEFHNRKKNGDLFWELAAIAPVRDVRGRITHYVAVKEDITERKATEQRLRQADKMKAIGELTGGIAHDFNNLLAIILGNMQLLEESLPPQDERRELVSDAIWSAERGAELTKRLLAFARRQPLHPASTDINHVIRRMTDLLRRTLGERIAIRENLADGLWNAMIDRGPLENALLNLVVNARDAMPDGGVLTITTENVPDGPPAAEDDGAAMGDAVLIAVNDTGVGIPPDVVSRIFDPFYTTKSFGKGSGLGLSMVDGFVDQSGGQITVESALGQGTTMRLYLPRAGAIAAAPAALESPVPQRGTRARRVVLVVEDHERLLKTACRVLEMEGYEVRLAENAGAAMEVVDKLPALDLLFCDVVLPDGIDGPYLARRVLERHPEARVLLTSGYAADSSGIDTGFAYLAKPYRREALVAKVHELLADMPQ